jgi:hypothetical protein
MSTPVSDSANIRRVVSQLDRVRIHQRGRICAQTGCDTILSVYNPATYCAAHVSQSPGARRRRLSQQPRVVACESCGQAFSTSNERRRFCSDRCRMAAFARRKRARQVDARRRALKSAPEPLLSPASGDAARAS